jgi:glyoxylase-like metal-dependent hydrolase (beta-lactamase superfamily II)
MKAVRIQTMGDRGQLTDGTRTIEFHRLQGYEHTGDMMVTYLPKEKILAEPDAFSPPPKAGMPLVVTAVPAARALHANIQRLKLDVQVIAPFHGNRKSDVAELAGAAGVTGTN